MDLISCVIEPNQILLFGNSAVYTKACEKDMPAFNDEYQTIVWCLRVSSMYLIYITHAVWTGQYNLFHVPLG